MVCMYTAQGEFLCRPNVEKYEEPMEEYYEEPMEEYANNAVKCYGINVNSASDCDTCGKVKNVITGEGKPFNAKNVTQCKAPGGSWKPTCRYGVVEKNGKFQAECKNVGGKWPARGTPKSSIDLLSCSSGKLKNINGVLQCE